MVLTIPIWIIYSLFGALFQIGRNSVQKSLKQYIPDLVVTWTRFFYGLPVIILFFLIANKADISLNWITTPCLLYGFLGGLSQILATYFLIQCFSFQNFAVSITYIKLETLFTAILGAFLFYDFISLFGSLLIATSFIGIIIISTTKEKESLTKQQLNIKHTGNLYGLLSGLFFAFASVLCRQANLALAIENPIIRGINTLALVIVFQTIVLTLFLSLKSPKDLLNAFKHSKQAFLAGLFGVSASTCWFIAFGLANAAYVKAVGQIDILFSIVISRKLFKETISIKEYIGIAIVMISISLFIFI